MSVSPTVQQFGRRTLRGNAHRHKLIHESPGRYHDVDSCLKRDGTVAKRNGHCVGPRSRIKLCNRPLHMPLNSSVREGQNFADLNDRFSCGYPSKYLTFAVAEFDILLGRIIEPLDVSERVKCHQMQ